VKSSVNSPNDGTKTICKLLSALNHKYPYGVIVIPVKIPFSKVKSKLVPDATIVNEISNPNNELETKEEAT